MHRCLINIAAVLSTVLLVATVVLWVRSYWILDTVYDTTERIEGEWYVRGSKQLFSNRGAFTFSRFGRWESMDGQPEYAQELYARRFGGIDPPRGWRTDSAEDLSGWIEGQPDRGALGFKWRTYEYEKDLEVVRGLKRIHVWEQQLVIPDWSLLVMFAGLPAMRIRRYLRSRRKADHCVSCGYDLTPATSPAFALNAEKTCRDETCSISSRQCWRAGAYRSISSAWAWNEAE